MYNLMVHNLVVIARLIARFIYLKTTHNLQQCCFTKITQGFLEYFSNIQNIALFILLYVPQWHFLNLKPPRVSLVKMISVD